MNKEEQERIRKEFEEVNKLGNFAKVRFSDKENTAAKELEQELSKYIKEGKTQEECLGFIDGFNSAQAYASKRVQQALGEVESDLKNLTYYSNLGDSYIKKTELKHKINQIKTKYK